MAKGASGAEVLSIGRSAIFLEKSGKLTAGDIEMFFTQCLDSINPTEVLERAIRRLRKDLNGSYSLVIFRIAREPSFLRGGKLLDQVHGFILLIERNNLAALLSKHAGSLDSHLPTELSRIGFETTLGLFSGVGATYESISLRTLGGGRGGLLRRAYDAEDLNAVMPRAGARRSAPSVLKVRRNEDTSRLAPGTSRVSRQGGRVDLKGLFDFVRAVEAELRNTKTSAFLESFAEPIELSSLPASVKPKSLLIHWHEVEDLIAGGQLEIKVGEETRPALDSEHRDLRAQLTSELSLGTRDDSGFTIVSADVGDLGTLKQTKAKFSVNSEFLASYHLVRNTVATPLDRLISSDQLFTIAFSDATYAYTGGAVFRNKRLPEELTNFLSCFVIIPELSNTESEKGHPTSKSTFFSPRSVFGVVEKYVCSADAIVICDDLGDEWADHIVLRSKSPPEIEFIHSKWKESVTSSASAFHDLVGQGTKKSRQPHCPSRGLI